MVGSPRGRQGSLRVAEPNGKLTCRLGDIVKGVRYDKIPGEGEPTLYRLVASGCELFLPDDRPPALMQAGLGCRSRATRGKSLR